MENLAIPQLIVTASAGFVLATIYARIWVPFGKPPQGREVHSTRLGILQKIMVHRWQILIVLALTNAGTLPGLLTLQMPILGVAMVIVMVILAILIPTRYRFTLEGFALGRGRIMPWSEFKRYRFGSGRIQFETKGDRPRKVDLFMNHVQQQALRPILKRYFRSASSAEPSSS